MPGSGIHSQDRLARRGKMWSRQPKFPPWIPPEARGWWPRPRPPAARRRLRWRRATRPPPPPPSPRGRRTRDGSASHTHGATTGCRGPPGADACRRRARRGRGIRRRGAARSPRLRGPRCAGPGASPTPIRRDPTRPNRGSRGRRPRARPRSRTRSICASRRRSASGRPGAPSRRQARGIDVVPEEDHDRARGIGRDLPGQRLQDGVPRARARPRRR